MQFTQALLLASVALFACFLGTDACDCMPLEKQPRNIGCPGEFLAVVTVTGSQRSGEMDLHLPFKLIDDFTPSFAEHKALKDFPYLTTAENSALCGVYLEVNSTYVLKGQLGEQPRLNSCGSYIKKLAQGHVPTKSESTALFEEVVKKFC